MNLIRVSLVSILYIRYAPLETHLAIISALTPTMLAIWSYDVEKVENQCEPALIWYLGKNVRTYEEIMKDGTECD